MIFVVDFGKYPYPFTAPDGMRNQWTVCPVGFQNSPMAMLFVLMTIFAGKMRIAGTYLYMDDLLTVGSAWQDQLYNLKSMFQTYAPII